MEANPLDFHSAISILEEGVSLSNTLHVMMKQPSKTLARCIGGRDKQKGET
jgi:exonuclease VII small subunit